MSVPKSSTSMFRDRKWATRASLRVDPKESAPAMIFRGRLPSCFMDVRCGATVWRIHGYGEVKRSSVKSESDE